MLLRFFRSRLYVRVIVIAILATVAVCLLYKAVAEAPHSDTAHHRPSSFSYGRLSHKRNEQYERLIRADLAKQKPGLGNEGEAVKLTGADYDKGMEDLARIALNEELSEQLSYNRTSPDGRNPSCQKKTYDVDSLPSASVIIIFYDEPYSVIVRTVHSVINTASQRNLKEVILVDDASTHDVLHGKLDYYVEAYLPRFVQIVRNKNRWVLLAHARRRK